MACAQRTEAPIAVVGGGFRVAAPFGHQVPSEEGPTGGFRRRIFLDDIFIGIELAPCHSTAEEAFFFYHPVSLCPLFGMFWRLELGRDRPLSGYQ